MSDRKDDGGSAFPMQSTPINGGSAGGGGGMHYYSSSGMSLRDYFAAKVMASLASEMAVTLAEQRSDVGTALLMTARLSYAAADAMLAERKR